MYGNDVSRYRKEASGEDADEDYDVEIEPIMFFPNGTRFKTGDLTGNSINEITKAFIPYQRKKKIAIVLDEN